MICLLIVGDMFRSAPRGLPDGPGAARASCGVAEVAEVEGLINEAVKMLAELLAYQLKTVKFQSLLQRRCKSPWNFGCDTASLGGPPGRLAGQGG